VHLPILPGGSLALWQRCTCGAWREAETGRWRVGERRSAGLITDKLRAIIASKTGAHRGVRDGLIRRADRNCCAHKDGTLGEGASSR